MGVGVGSRVRVAVKRCAHSHPSSHNIRSTLDVYRSIRSKRIPRLHAGAAKREGAVKWVTSHTGHAICCILLHFQAPGGGHVGKGSKDTTRAQRTRDGVRLWLLGGWQSVAWLTLCCILQHFQALGGGHVGQRSKNTTRTQRKRKGVKRGLPPIAGSQFVEFAAFPSTRRRPRRIWGQRTQRGRSENEMWAKRRVCILAGPQFVAFRRSLPHFQAPG